MVKRSKTSPAKRDDARVFLLLTLFRGLDWIDEGLGNILAYHGWPRVTRPQSLIMALIYAGESRPVEIARRLGMSRQAVHRVLGDMVAAKLIVLRDDPTDKRAKRVEFAPGTDRIRADARAALNELDRQVSRMVGGDTVVRLHDAFGPKLGPPYDPAKRRR
ncbi:MAG: MarR family transcriptional regulator [Alphaproteobacteria bacterium]|nr:MarR family transcriptional regulator [Alphaproteobacteria bacterium]